MAIVLLFPLAEFWWAYAAFTAFVLLLLALDLGVFHRKAHVVSFRESLGWSILWIVLALVFNYGFYLYAVSRVGPDAGRQAGLEFLTGYIVERSLAIDNIFVFVLVFNYFGVPPVYQHRVLFYGIFGALVFRAAFIAVGAALMQYHAVVLILGVFLVLTGIKLLWSPEQEIAPEKNPLIKLFRRVVPYLASGFSDFDGFDAWLRADPVHRDDELFLLDKLERGNMHDVVRGIGHQIQLTVWPEDFIISPDPPAGGGGTGPRTGCRRRGADRGRPSRSSGDRPRA